MPDADRIMAKRIYALVKEHAPGLAAKTWYGVPVYTRDGKTVCFFQATSKFGTRYAALSLESAAHLEGDMWWRTSFALFGVGPDEERRIVVLLHRAAG
jgi:uncharacterized protein YdhG (YjbR/CyaY superfamily)